MRELETPVKEFTWSMEPSGDIINPVVNCAKFVPRQDLILVGVSDHDISAKCLDAQTGETVDNFINVRGSCYSLDVSPDGGLCSFGDSEGTLHFHNLNYTG